MRRRRSPQVGSFEYSSGLAVEGETREFDLRLSVSAMERVTVDELNLSTEREFARNWEFGQLDSRQVRRHA